LELADDGAADLEFLDIRRVYRMVDDSPEFRAVIDQPMASWIAFLHPTQRRLAYGSFKGAVKVSGSAGTGKTVVALHRARNLAQQGKRVLLTTYEETLCGNLREQLALLCSNDELANIKVSTVHDVAVGLLESIGTMVKWDREGQTEAWLKEIADETDYARPPEWYVMEWEHVIHANDIRTLEEYLEVSRVGRGSALRERDRKVVWGVFEQLFAKVQEAGITDGATICRMAREALDDGAADWPCDVVVVDEMQDLRPQELRFLSVLGNEMPDGLMLVGDMTQRIYVPRFTLKSAGIDVVGRSQRLRINYRTTRQIRDLADRIVAPPGGKCPDRALSVWEGPEPHLRPFADDAEEAKFVCGAVARLVRSGGFEPHDIAVFAPDPRMLDSVVDGLAARAIAVHRLSRQGMPDGHVRAGAMRRAKGLEFKAVFVMGASADAVPDPATVRHLFEPASLEEALERERQTLYVAMTRARDELTVTWVGEPSPFLDEVLNPEP
jgi:superfamily I DNA/RNA helicase